MTYQPTGLGAQWFKERHAFNDTESYEAHAERVGYAVGKDEQSREDYSRAIGDGLLSPGGRISRAAGRPVQMMLNCFNLPTGDSREAWGRVLSDTLVVSGMGGGVGTNYSTVRGRGEPVRGIGGTATGAVSNMRLVNALGGELGQYGGRRIALMQALNVDHPDTPEFMNAKLIDGELTNANVSLIIPEYMSADEFLHAARNNHVLPQRFEGRETGTHFNPKVALDTMVANALQSGEPGLLNQHLAQQESNVSYLYPLTCTNPCGEIWLPDYGSCCLASLVLPRFVADGQVQWPELHNAVRLGVRFLDDVLDANLYPLDSIRERSLGERRLGLGVMGLHSMLLDLGLRYTDPQALSMVDELFEFISNTAYQASAELAKERGCFEGFDKNEVLSRPYVHRLWRETRALIAEQGLRNVALLTVAPTGTTSVVQGVTGGIEPLFSAAYIRRNFTQDEGTQETLVVHKDYLDHQELYQGALDIAPRYHLLMQEIVQRRVDNSVSKTINLPENTQAAQVQDLLAKFLPRIKGVTMYRQGSRGQEPMSAIGAAKMQDMILGWEGPIDYDGAESQECVGGMCSV